jgi:hypothetical protein
MDPETRPRAGIIDTLAVIAHNMGVPTYQLGMILTAAAMPVLAMVIALLFGVSR